MTEQKRELIPRIKQLTMAREALSLIISKEDLEADTSGVMKLGAMTWIDDGKKDIESVITIKGQSLEEK